MDRFAPLGRSSPSLEVRWAALSPMTSTLNSAGLLVLRAVVGVTFLLHGLDKLGDLGAVEQNFDGLGIPAPAVMAPFVALTETIGGALLILGLLTPLAGLALAINMLVAGLTAHTGNGFFAQDGGYELVLVLGAASLSLALAGAGRFSVDHMTGLVARLKTSEKPADDHRTGRFTHEQPAESRQERAIR